jgi:TrkA domain protein
MGDVQETDLPGIGRRFEFRASGGEHVAVVVHRSGIRELAVFDNEDPDVCRSVLRLSPGDARTLGELLGRELTT